MKHMLFGAGIDERGGGGATAVSLPKSLAIVLALLLLVAGAIVFSPKASADTTVTVLGSSIGIYPRSSPEMSQSNKVGAALPDGSPVSAVCEIRGSTVTSSYDSTDSWLQLADGTYLPSAYLATGSSGWSASIVDCTASAPAAGSSASGPESLKVRMADVCKDQDHTTATWERPGDPYSWRCIDITHNWFGWPSTTGYGSLDVAAWCERNLSGSTATVTNANDVDSWYCIR